jgi:hypothetical protein
MSTAPETSSLIQSFLPSITEKFPSAGKTDGLLSLSQDVFPSSSTLVSKAFTLKGCLWMVVAPLTFYFVVAFLLLSYLRLI